MSTEARDLVELDLENKIYTLGEGYWFLKEHTPGGETTAYPVFITVKDETPGFWLKRGEPDESFIPLETAANPTTLIPFRTNHQRFVDHLIREYPKGNEVYPISQWKEDIQEGELLGYHEVLAQYIEIETPEEYLMFLSQIHPKDDEENPLPVWISEGEYTKSNVIDINHLLRKNWIPE